MRPSTIRSPRNGLYQDRQFRQQVDVTLKDLVAAAVVVAGLIAAALLAVAMIAGAFWLVVVIVGDIVRRLAG